MLSWFKAKSSSEENDCIWDCFSPHSISTWMQSVPVQKSPNSKRKLSNSQEPCSHMSRSECGYQRTRQLKNVVDREVF